MMGLLGIKYVENGRDVEKDGGLDCWGLVREAYRLLGIAGLPEYMVDGRALRGDTFQAESGREPWVAVGRPEAHCVVLFRLNDGGWHCGVVLPDRRRFIHCRKPCAVIEALDAQMWARAIRGYYKYEKK